MKSNLKWLTTSLLLIAVSCTPSGKRLSTKYPIITKIKQDKSSPFYVDFQHYPTNRKALPVGVFDSGTGGLTVLEAILNYDQHNNVTHKPGADGIPDFKSEYFEYLADDANMPYGRYDAEGKADFLRELVIKDVRFILGNTYFLSPRDTIPQTDKKPVKAIVIACNTATAFGLETVRKATREWGLNMNILGIIEAGVKETLRQMKGKKGVIGILATEGTCASNGYPRTIKKLLPQFPEAGKVFVIQQPGIGLAGAIDGDQNYIDPQAKSLRSSANYKGPSVGNPKYPIDLASIRQYNFDTTGNQLLVKKDKNGKWIQIQLNSVSNYIKYMATNMTIKMTKNYPGETLNEVILGCTHYPYYTKQIRAQFLYLKTLNKKYDKVIPEDISFIDPAKSLAGELYNYLYKNKLWASSNNRNSRFFISVPNPDLKQNKIDKQGRFLYSYKYGRKMNQSLQYVKIVPFSTKCIKESVRERIEEDVPSAWQLIQWQ